MKRVIVILCLYITSVIIVYAQSVEVRGIETDSVITYEDGDYRQWGFSFTNKNNFKVSVEAELWYRNDNYNKNELLDTKDFIINAGTTYIWDKHFTTYMVVSCFVKYKAYKMD